MPTTMPRLGGAVMAHPRRRREAEAIAALAPGGFLRVVLDPDPTGPPTAVRTAALAWSAVAPGATHHLVLEDDVRLDPGFFAHVRRAARAFPDAAVAFYTNWNSRNGAAVRMAALAGADWAEGLDEYTPCLALMLPAPVARGYRAYADTTGAGWPYDVLMHRYLASAGVPLYLSVPNPVEHSDIPSVAGNAAHGPRRSACFAAPAATVGVSAAVSANGERVARFDVVPFYKHGVPHCAVRRENSWEYVETERQLRRWGLAESAYRPRLPAGEPLTADARDVWLTGFAMGYALHDAPSVTGLSRPHLALRALESLWPGGRCDELTAERITEDGPRMLRLASAAVDAGRSCARRPRRPAPPRRTPLTLLAATPTPFTVAVAGYLEDLGHRVEVRPGRTALPHVADATHVVHLTVDPGTPDDPALFVELLAAAEKSGVRHVVLAGTAELRAGASAVRGARSSTAPDLHVLRIAQPVGPHAPADSLVARWIRRAWRSQPLTLRPGRVHRLTDIRDIAAAIDEVLRLRPRPPVLDIASATYGESELADLVCAVTRQVPRTVRSVRDVREVRDARDVRTVRADAATTPATSAPTTPLAQRAPSRKESISVEDGMRAFAQYLAYDGGWRA
ncbi:NAD(P)-dependent oxidoreductase [Streptomyces sp. NPDC015346]|uniref:NAD(P)-dependent oxidoreductase n=1 Tax=Streptomyces sp. NPDC015346 TaxID=3364954 RepID=UPI0036F8F3C3